jgi:hypothetical protein
MVTRHAESRITTLELQLEEAVQMLRLASQNKRTCLEIEEWLLRNHPEDQGDALTVSTLMRSSRTKSDDK